MFPLQGGVPAAGSYVDDLFSTYTYTGTGASQAVHTGLNMLGVDSPDIDLISARYTNSTYDMRSTSVNGAIYTLVTQRNNSSWSYFFHFSKWVAGQRVWTWYGSASDGTDFRTLDISPDSNGDIVISFKHSNIVFLSKRSAATGAALARFTLSAGTNTVPFVKKFGTNFYIGYSSTIATVPESLSTLTSAINITGSNTSGVVDIAVDGSGTRYVCLNATTGSTIQYAVAKIPTNNTVSWTNYYYWGSGTTNYPENRLTVNTGTMTIDPAGNNVYFGGTGTYYDSSRTGVFAQVNTSNGQLTTSYAAYDTRQSTSYGSNSLRWLSCNPTNGNLLAGWMTQNGSSAQATYVEYTSAMATVGTPVSTPNYYDDVVATLSPDGKKSLSGGNSNTGEKILAVVGGNLGFSTALSTSSFVSNTNIVTYTSNISYTTATNVSVATVSPSFTADATDGLTSGTLSGVTFDGIQIAAAKAGLGGMVWVKSRSSATASNIVDTVRGAGVFLQTSATSAQGTSSALVQSFISSGYTGTVTDTDTTVSWTFRRQPKFFDVVTWSGDGQTFRDIPHNLQSVPGCVIIKRTNGASNWWVWHRSLNPTAGVYLNTTDSSQDNVFDSSFATSSTFQALGYNTSGANYVAYIFAHNAGGFGPTGMENAISCGSFTTDASAIANVTLGYEPQWLLVKNIQATGNNWFLWDVVRGWTIDGRVGDFYQIPNSPAADGGGGDYGGPNATGFTIRSLQASNTFIYIAVRRSMKVPTKGTQVFSALTRTGTGTTATIGTVGFAPDLVHTDDRTNTQTTSKGFFDRMRGPSQGLITHDTAAEFSDSTDFLEFTSTGVKLGSSSGFNLANTSGIEYAYQFFRRARGFMDIVCYTGTGSATTVNHNLGVAPELMIVKRRSGVAGWATWGPNLGVGSFGLNSLLLDSTAQPADNGAFLNTPTATQYSVSIYGATNASGETYVAYLFATCKGVSKVGSYTGNGSSQTIDCGFTSGARYVLIKSISATGGWYVWDTARGIVSANDPYILYNSTAAEVTSNDSIDPASSGFIVNQNATTNVNVNGASYIYLAIA